MYCSAGVGASRSHRLAQHSGAFVTMSIVVVGAGAIGLLVAGRLAQAGEPAVLLARPGVAEAMVNFRLLPGELSEAAGELTPSLKIKRKKVAEQFAAEIESMYPPEGAMAL